MAPVVFSHSSSNKGISANRDGSSIDSVRRISACILARKSSWTTDLELCAFINVPEPCADSSSACVADDGSRRWRRSTSSFAQRSCLSLRPSQPHDSSPAVAFFVRLGIIDLDRAPESVGTCPTCSGQAGSTILVCSDRGAFHSMDCGHANGTTIATDAGTASTATTRTCDRVVASDCLREPETALA